MQSSRWIWHLPPYATHTAPTQRVRIASIEWSTNTHNSVSIFFSHTLGSLETARSHRMYTASSNSGWYYQSGAACKQHNQLNTKRTTEPPRQFPWTVLADPLPPKASLRTNSLLLHSTERKREKKTPRDKPVHTYVLPPRMPQLHQQS